MSQGAIIGGSSARVVGDWWKKDKQRFLLVLVGRVQTLAVCDNQETKKCKHLGEKLGEKIYNRSDICLKSMSIFGLCQYLLLNLQEKIYLGDKQEL